MSDELDLLPIRQFTVYRTFAYAQPPTRLWAAITDGIGQWWTERFHPEARSSLEPVPGGQWRQTWSSGGALIATVAFVDIPHRLRLIGPLLMAQPVHNVVDIALEEMEAGGTRLHLQHQAFGVLEPDADEVYDAGWTELFDEALPAFLEGR